MSEEPTVDQANADLKDTLAEANTLLMDIQAKAKAKLKDRLARAKPAPLPLPPPRSNGRARRSPTRPAASSRILQPRSRMFVVIAWLARQVNAGHPKILARTKRFATWALYLIPRMSGFVSAVAGPRLDWLATQERNKSCDTCPRLQIRLTHRDPWQRLYCGACGCPKWPLSELHWKNRLRRWRCPIGRHKQLEEDPSAWSAIRAAEAVRVKTVNEKVGAATMELEGAPAR